MWKFGSIGSVSVFFVGFFLAILVLGFGGKVKILLTLVIVVRVLF